MMLTLFIKWHIDYMLVIFFYKCDNLLFQEVFWIKIFIETKCFIFEENQNRKKLHSCSIAFFVRSTLYEIQRGTLILIRKLQSINKQNQNKTHEHIYNTNYGRMKVETKIEMKPLKVRVWCVWGRDLITSFKIKIVKFSHNFNFFRK